jgi:hypothetical protein
MLASSLNPSIGDKLSPKLYNKQYIKRALDLSRIAYYSPDEIKNMNIHLPNGLCDLPTYYNGNKSLIGRNCQAYSGRFDKDTQLWVTFKGSSSVDDFFDGVRCGKTKIRLPNHPKLEDIYLHTGFVEQFMSVQGAMELDIMRTINARTNIREIIFTGHSRGQSNAQIAGLYFGSLLKIDFPKIKIKIIGFGGPRSGSGEDFEMAFSTCIDEHVRIINEDDIVPLLPPNPIGFDHVGHSIWMHNGKLYDRTENTVINAMQYGIWNMIRPLKTIEDHLLDKYMDNIDKCF